MPGCRAALIDDECDGDAKYEDSCQRACLPQLHPLPQGLRGWAGRRRLPRRADRCGVGLAKQRFERAQQLLKRHARGILTPGVEVGRVQAARIDRQAGILEAHRHENAPIGGLTGFAAHPSGVN